ncbi:MAG TPA: hypothetical protein VFO16_02540 [Pseudonocardiaceae bacterium]|nr:hypothetical protein [Pseudonocardiaceae bacterium]
MSAGSGGFAWSDGELILVLVALRDAMHVEKLSIENLCCDRLEKYGGTATFDNGVPLAWRGRDGELQRS